MKRKLLLAMCLFLVCMCIFGCSSNTNSSAATPVAPIVSNGSVNKTSSNRPSRKPSRTTSEFVFSHTDQTIDRALKLLGGADASMPKRDEMMTDLKKVPSYLREQLPKLEGKSIHAILVNHGDPTNLSVEPESETIASQAKVLRILTQTKPTLLALEGFSVNRLATKDDLVSEMLLMVSQEEFKKRPNYPKKLEEGIQQILSRQAAAKYALENKDCHAFGGEIFGLNVLTLMTSDSSAPPEGRQLYGELQPIRSWIILSRLSEFMQKNNSIEGTLVMGSFHQQEIADAAKAFGFKITFHDTTI